MVTTFRDFLINEIAVDIDPDDPESLTQVRHDLRMAQNNPEKLRRMKLQQARQDQQQAQQAEGPTAALQARIARTKQYLAQLEQQLSRMQQAGVQQ